MFGYISDRPDRVRAYSSGAHHQRAAFIALPKLEEAALIKGRRLFEAWYYEKKYGKYGKTKKKQFQNI